MEPILAESAPPRGRALVFAAALAVAAAIAALAVRPHPSHHRRHQLRMEQCMTSCYGCALR